MRVLLTGASGFTGRHLIGRLRRDGTEIFALGMEAVDGVDGNLVTDIADRDRLSAWLKDVRPTHIIHLAALSHVEGDALDFYRVNVIGTEAMLLSVQAAGCSPERIVVASSANLYGNSRHSPIAETAPLNPANHYAVSKAAMELTLMRYRDSLPIIVTRPFNYTGPGQSERFVYAKIAGAFARRDPVLTLGNIAVARDLSDVRDVCEAYARLLAAPVDGLPVNICSGTSVSLEQTIEMLRAITGHDPQIEVDPALVRGSDIRELTGDPSRLYDLVGQWDRISARQTLADMLAD
jgi:nucleoside-diphosphate-sugar epimerase